MEIQHLIHLGIRGVPLWIVGLCGLAGVLIDIDHLISYWNRGHFSQVAHIPVAVVSFFVLCVACACCGGLYLKLVLTK
jgi:hypothetical protein